MSVDLKAEVNNLLASQEAQARVGINCAKVISLCAEMEASVVALEMEDAIALGDACPVEVQSMVPFVPNASRRALGL